MVRSKHCRCTGKRTKAGPLLRRLAKCVVSAASADGNGPNDGSADNSEGGFTLVEVIVAVAILATSLAVLLNVISNALQSTAVAERMAASGLLAQSLLAAVGNERPLAVGETVGEMSGEYRWRVATEMLGDATERLLWPTGAYKVVVEVSWGEGSQQRSYALSTIRLGPKGTKP